MTTAHAITPMTAMSAKEYRAALVALGFPQGAAANDAGLTQAARFFGVTSRASRIWAEAGPPNPVAVCLRLMLASKINLALAQRRLATRPARKL
jgi:hypothetical protein